MPMQLLPHEQTDRNCYGNNAAANAASNFCDNTVNTCVLRTVALTRHAAAHAHRPSFSVCHTTMATPFSIRVRVQVKIHVVLLPAAFLI